MRRVLLLVALILASAAAVSVALAQSGPLEIAWSTIDGGGTTAAHGGDFVLSGSLGQADAGTSTGGVYALHGGFWGLHSAAPLPPGDHHIYLPLIRR